jgi:transposase
VGARPAGPRRGGSRGGEHRDPGACHLGPGHLRGRDPAARRARPRRNKKYLQVACTNLLTYYFLGERTLPSFKDFIYSDLHGTVIVHDRYVNYDHFDGVSHQLCTSHLLRDVEDAAQVYPHAHWPAQIARELRALIHAANTARGQGLDQVPDDWTAEHLTLFRNAVNAGLSQVSRVPGAKAKQRPGRLLLECLKNREADVLRFLTDTAIPPTSNQAERDLRPAKTQQKISGRLRSEKTTRDRYAIRGYASTAAKHGVAVFTAIYAALAGNPGIPPLGLTLIASVRRRRRELALLKTLGFTQRQLAAMVAWQSSVSAIAGVIVALPLGIGIRRWLWTLFAQAISAVPDPHVPVLYIGAVAFGTVLFADLAAVFPGIVAVRTPTALLLRTE